jgi:hypothetical protein
MAMSGSTDELDPVAKSLRALGVQDMTVPAYLGDHRPESPRRVTHLHTMSTPKLLS